MSFLDTLFFYVVYMVDKFELWHRLPVLLGLAYLALRRRLHQRYNLLHVHVGTMTGTKYDVDQYSHRTADGKCNHPTDDIVGSQGTAFGRNMPPSTTNFGVLEPHPSVVAAKLLERRKFVDCGKQFNMIACSWLQDGSVIYGNDEAGMEKVRSYKDGKLKISRDGLLEHDEKGIPVSGDVRNCWAGFSLLQALFIKEHNVVCDMLKEHYPDLNDDKLYHHARLITSATIAKIHTIDWTVELLKTDTLLAAMRINWYGLLGKKVKDSFGNIFGPELSGVNMKDMIGKEGEKRLSKIGMEKMLVSMGYQSCGAITLWNYPLWMRNLVAHDINGEERPDLVDMASMEIYRDRERKIPRYNEFRKNMLMIPISKWDDLTDDEEVIEALQEVYGDDVEKLDLLVGMHAEKKIKGFAISETAFFIFVLIASRRLEADRFFTTNFNSQTYTKEGLQWINKIESLKDVIDRHFPEMSKTWMRCSSAFSVWDSDTNARNYVPLYLR
ncbi:heme peroxidase [Cynara cardunculus var. scolymus]|uniref:Heme peroxidase n=1 Tax=Cynara cardunculus var. scolymus TaxID=59895 RepID=A0A103Y8Q5_CYNCS|nr:heme peroxidase [Cynara cardunculus var. scolymus]